MSVWLETVDGARELAGGDFPLVVGGDRADVAVDGAPGPVAYLGLADGELFLQPAAGDDRTGDVDDTRDTGDTVIVAVNGTAVTGAQWLRPGDAVRCGGTRVLVDTHDGATRLRVREASADEDRGAPPVLVPPARPARDTGPGLADLEAAGLGIAGTGAAGSGAAGSGAAGSGAAGSGYGAPGAADATVVPPAVRPIDWRPASARGARRRWRPRLGGLAALLLIAALAAAAGYVFTARPVAVAIEPAPDRVELAGFPFMPRIGDRYLLRPGTYDLIAEKTGYVRLETPLEVTGDARQSFRFTLVEKPGRIAVTSDVADAEVSVDGEVAGTTPLALELAPGVYELRVRAERYRDFVHRLEVTGGGAEQTVRAELAPRWAEVAFASEPPGARLRVDGRELGTTPMTVELLDGERTYELTLAGYKPHRASVEVVAQTPLTLDPVRLRPADGNLLLLSEPAAATVTVDGVYRGETPLDLDLAPGRAHAVEVSKAGYDPARREVEVASGATRELRLELVPQEVEVQVSGWPPDAELWVDGEPRGAAVQTLTLTAVAHTIELRKPGFETFRTTLTPLPGFPQVVEVTLKPAGAGARRPEQTAEASPGDGSPGEGSAGEGSAREGSAREGSAREGSAREGSAREGSAREGSARDRSPGESTGGLPREGSPRDGSPRDATAAAGAPGTAPAERPVPVPIAPGARVIRSTEGHELRRFDPLRVTLGASRREPGRRANETLREVELVRPYFLATREVSNEQFRRFREEHLSGQVGGVNLEIDHHPVVRVSWRDAAEYCNWLSRKEGLEPAYVFRGGALVAAEPMTTGYRLPTEAEWARAARYPAGAGEPLKYPWGDALPVAPGSGNYADRSARGLLPRVLEDYHDGFPATAPVDAFPPNALGIQNLGGNVAEWVHDFYAIRPGGGAVERDPFGPAAGELHVIRGASWMHATVTELRLSFRDYGTEPRPDVGFRIARYVQ